MSGKPYFTWMPWQLEFVRDHCTPREIAAHFGCAEARVHEAIRTLSIRRTLCHLTALHTPPKQGDRCIAAGVDRATLKDAYLPMSLAEFHAIYPDGLRPE